MFNFSKTWFQFCLFMNFAHCFRDPVGKCVGLPIPMKICWAEILSMSCFQYFIFTEPLFLCQWCNASVLIDLLKLVLTQISEIGGITTWYVLLQVYTNLYHSTAVCFVHAVPECNVSDLASQGAVFTFLIHDDSGSSTKFAFTFINRCLHEFYVTHFAAGKVTCR